MDTDEKIMALSAQIESLFDFGNEVHAETRAALMAIGILALMLHERKSLDAREYVEALHLKAKPDTPITAQLVKLAAALA